MAHGDAAPISPPAATPLPETDMASQRARKFVESWMSRPRNGSHVHIRDPVAVARKIAAVLRDGPGHLHIIADFDHTMTKLALNGKHGLSTHSVIKSSPTMSPAFRAAGQALFDKYYPIEINPAVPRAEKYHLMEEWVRKSNDLIVAESLRREDLTTIVRANPFLWRPGVHDLISRTGDLDVYFMVFSAGVKDVIQAGLCEAGLLQPHVHIVSNQMVFDADDKLVAFAEPTIHPFNKAEIVLRGDTESAHRHLGAIRDRNNVLVMGDTLGDSHMADGVRHSVALRIGFCNHDADAWLDQFEAAFDVVVLDDTGFDWPLQLIDLMHEHAGHGSGSMKAARRVGRESATGR